MMTCIAIAMCRRREGRPLSFAGFVVVQCPVLGMAFIPYPFFGFGFFVVSRVLAALRRWEYHDR